MAPLAESSTDTVAVPAVVNKVLATVTMIEVVVLPAVIGSCVVLPPKVQLTTAVVVGKLVPVTVRVTEPVWPASAEVGLMLVITGPGKIVKGSELLEIRPPV